MCIRKHRYTACTNTRVQTHVYTRVETHSHDCDYIKGIHTHTHTNPHDFNHTQGTESFVRRQEDRGCTCVLVATQYSVLGAVAIMVRVHSVMHNNCCCFVFAVLCVVVVSVVVLMCIV